MTQDRYLTEHTRFIHAFFRRYAGILVIGLVIAVLAILLWEHPAAQGLGGTLTILWVISLSRCIMHLQREGKHCRSLPDHLERERLHVEFDRTTLQRERVHGEKNYFQKAFLVTMAALVILLLAGTKNNLTGVVLAFLIVTTIEQVALVILDQGLSEYAYQLEKRMGD